jgi:hypothetical protein
MEKAIGLGYHNPDGLRDLIQDYVNSAAAE